jgi:hypothetical protein
MEFEETIWNTIVHVFKSFSFILSYYLKLLNYLFLQSSRQIINFHPYLKWRREVLREYVVIKFSTRELWFFLHSLWKHHAVIYSIKNSYSFWCFVLMFLFLLLWGMHLLIHSFVHSLNTFIKSLLYIKNYKRHSRFKSQNQTQSSISENLQWNEII